MKLIIKYLLFKSTTTPLLPQSAVDEDAVSWIEEAAATTSTNAANSVAGNHVMNNSAGNDEHEATSLTPAEV